MTITNAYPPIAMATVVFVLWVIIAHRLHRRDLPNGTESLAQIGWLLILPASLLAYFWLNEKENLIDTWGEMFATTITGISMGSLLLYLIKSAFFEGKKSGKDFALHVVYLIFFVGLFVSGLFI